MPSTTSPDATHPRPVIVKTWSTRNRTALGNGASTSNGLVGWSPPGGVAESVGGAGLPLSEGVVLLQGHGMVQEINWRV